MRKYLPHKKVRFFLPDGKLITNKNTIIKIVLNKNNLLFCYCFIIINKKMKFTSLLLFFGIKETDFYCDEIDHVKLQNFRDNT